MTHDKNPFIQDPERLETSSRRAWCCKNLFTPICIILVGAIGLIWLIYVLATLNPLGFAPDNREPYDVSRPIRRWPATVLVNSTPLATSPGTKPSMETTTFMETTTIMETTVKYHSDTRDIDSVDYQATYNEPTTTESSFTTDLTTIRLTVDHSGWTASTTEPQAMNTSAQPQDPGSDPLYNLKYPQIPTPAMCIPSRMSQEEFLDKQWYCYYCWQEALNGTYSTPAKSETEYRVRCHSNCYYNYAFHSCAIHLYQVETHLPSNGSVRQCRYCKRHMLNALNRTTTIVYKQ